jgi:hypothetical protein
MRLGGSLRLLVSATARDVGAGVAPLQESDLAALAGAYAGHGLAVVKARPATLADVAASHSIWASAWARAASVRPGCWRPGCGPGPGQRSSARRGPAWSRRPAAASMPAQGSAAASRSATVRRVWRPGAQPSSSDQSSGIETGAPGRARTA